MFALKEIELVTYTLQVVGWRLVEPGACDKDLNWVGETMVFRGTVSQILMKDLGSHTWVYIHFKESPDLAQLGCSPAPNLLREMFGADLNTLVGKTVEMAGVVERCGSLTGGGIRVVDRNQIRILGAR